MLKKTLSRRDLLKWGGIATLAGIAGEGFIFEPNRLDHEIVKVPIKDLPVEFEGYRISLFSDIHYPYGSDSGFIQRAVDMAMEFKPDLIALPGDFFHRRQRGVLFRLDGIFDDLKAKDGVYGVLGNHDHWYTAAESSRVIQGDTPIKLIDNQGFQLTRGEAKLAIGGVGDLWMDEVRMEDAFKGVSADTPRILLSHNPDVAEYYPGKVERVDLQLSGHTHGGQAVIPGLIDPTRHVSKFGSKFNRGLVEGQRHRVYVTKGLARLRGVRFLAPPEVTGIILTRAA